MTTHGMRRIGLECKGCVHSKILKVGYAEQVEQCATICRRGDALEIGSAARAEGVGRDVTRHSVAAPAAHLRAN